MEITTHGRKAAASNGFKAEVVSIHTKLGHDAACVFIAIVLCANHKGEVALTDERLAAFMNTYASEINDVLLPLIMDRNRRN